MLSATDQAKRAGRITASTLAAVLGFDQWCSRFQAWQRITGRDQGTSSPAAHEGNELEDGVCQGYARETGFRLVQGYTVVSACGMLAATPDRFVYDGDRLVKLLEVKCVGARMRHLWVNGPPEKVLIQVQFQMHLTGVSQCDVLAFFGPSDRQIFTVDYDPDTAAALVQLAQDFYRVHVATGLPPEVDATSDQVEEYVAALFPTRKGLRTPPSESAEHAMAQELATLKRQQSELKKRADVLQNQLILAMESAESTQYADGSRLTATKSKTTGWKAIAEAVGFDEELKAEHTKQTISFRFTPGKGEL